MGEAQEEGLLSVLARQCIEDSERWFGDAAAHWSIPHHALAMCGEAGEFANLVKKIERGSLDIKDPKVRYDLAMELTDVFVYLLNLAGLLRLDLEKTYLIVRGNNEKRFMAERAARAGRRAVESNGQGLRPVKDNPQA